MKDLTRRERERLRLQQQLEADPDPETRHDLGQYATPHDLATAIVKRALQFLGRRAPVRFLDPAFGTGCLFSALLGNLPSQRVRSTVGFEVDPKCGERAAELWSGTPLDLRIADFTHAIPPASEEEKPNLIVCNPPYVRHERIEQHEKRRVQDAVERSCGLRLSLRAGRQAHFLLLAHSWLAPDGIGAWLLPAWITEVAAGAAVREYLTDRVTLLRLHEFGAEGLRFGDVHVAATVVWLRKSEPPSGHEVVVTTGDDLTHPDLERVVGIDSLRGLSKWNGLSSRPLRRVHPAATLGELFTVTRGIATGANRFFILTEGQAIALDLPRDFLRPVLPCARDLAADEVLADAEGMPLAEPKLLLLDCHLSLDEIDDLHPSLGYYLRCHEEWCSDRALCKRRAVWYAQEEREPAPLLCTTLGRSDPGGRPFRFILNHSRALATNGYLMLYPRPQLAEATREDPGLLRRVWEALRAIPMDDLIAEGRTYGGGLHKLEPRELERVPMSDLGILRGG
jgi:methylase of polypeptide subunit release factors